MHEGKPPAHAQLVREFEVAGLSGKEFVKKILVAQKENKGEYEAHFENGGTAETAPPLFDPTWVPDAKFFHNERARRKAVAKAGRTKTEVLITR